MGYTEWIRSKVGRDMIIVVGTGIFIHKDGKVLLQKRSDNQLWSFHGGGMELGEGVEESARRELFEETGLAAHKMEFLGVFSGKGMEHAYPNGDQISVVGIIYACEDFSGEPTPAADEVLELRWFDIGNMPQEEEINPPDRRPFKAFVEWHKSRGGVGTGQL